MECGIKTLPSILITAGTLLSTSLAAPTPQLLTWDEAYIKAEALVSQMSLEQMVNITTGTKWRRTPCIGNTYSVSEPDFPALCLQDGPLGIRHADNVTAGVAGVTAASSWDKQAIRERGRYMGREFRGKGIHVQLGPSVDIVRAPDAGRNWEGFGEDPYLQGVAGAETVLGIQEEGVVATAKHYVFNNQETNRKASTSNVDERTFHEIYLWPYARMVEAGVGSVMCSYNMIDDIWGCENDYTMNTVLKGELGFRGYIMSDWGATHSTVLSVNSGLDMTMPGDIIMGDDYTYFGSNLTDAVDRGEVTAERVADMTTRIVATYYKMGQDKDFPETAVNFVNRTMALEVFVQADHHKHVRSMGAAGTVLLKNDGVLPLSIDSIDTLALIGSDASDDPNGPNSCVSRGCSNGTLAMGWGSGTADFPYLITPHQGIEAHVGDDVELTYTFWDWDVEEAAEIARQADIALVFSNADSGEEHIIVDGNVGDRNNLSLWHNGDALIEAAAEANENVVVIIHAVSPVLMPWIDNPHVRAVVWSGIPGQESGNSLVDILFGAVNPSGRLPYTIARNEEDYGVLVVNETVIEYTEKLELGYKHFDAHDIEPLFEFGFGLSYTTFEYSEVEVDTEGEGDDIKVTATVEVTNSGDVDGAEIPQAYISFPESAGEPPKHLRGFEKVYLKAGKKSKVTFEFGKTELSIWDSDSHEWVIPSGEFTVHVGASSRDIRDSVSFTVE
ncbi:glycoside hydrolase superfamily [Zychaea mexicana]|uniref:glycoside hydrolase superfamily n=1 Tax=Zychaea mexicana TaxID=64656 RepID=UPI0022FF3EEA|nr:glycoside hydrolase superfamily [Zychaea mexicana]KAI9493635.1 glycoside hydrolase superfamily [Zychaea mexicana]